MKRITLFMSIAALFAMIILLPFSAVQADGHCEFADGRHQDWRACAVIGAGRSLWRRCHVLDSQSRRRRHQRRLRG